MPEFESHSPNQEELKAEKESLTFRLAQIQQKMSEIEANPIVTKVGQDKARLAKILRSGAARTNNQDLLDRLDYHYDEMTISEMLDCDDEILLASGALTLQEVQRSFADSDRNELAFKELQQYYGELVDQRKQITDRLSEIESLCWPFETLTQETLQKQHEAQRLAYLEVGLIKTLSSDKEGFELNGQEYLFPTIQELQEHLTQDPESLNFFQEKIKQGFTEIQISPFYLPLNQIIQTVDKKIVEHNKGSVKAKPAFRSDSWQQADLEKTLKYFTQLNSTQDGIDKNSGLTKEEIINQHQQNPLNQPYLFNGYLISLVEPGDEINLASDNSSELNGRTPLKAGQTGIDYLKLFQDPKSPYFDESTITPEEELSLFVQKLYEKYLKDGKDIEKSGSDIFETKGWCWFVNCLLSSGLLPGAGWDPDARRIRMGEDKTGGSSGRLAPRPAVRRKS